MKRSIDDLALFGGTPAFAEKLHVGRPNIGDRAILHQRLDEILDSRWLTNNGPQVDQLEAILSERLGVKHAIAFTNGTVALEVAARALGLTGEVIVPSFTFIATAHALQWMGVRPVFADVVPGGHHIDPASVEALITERTSGIVPVHVWGEPADTEALETIADRHHLKVLYDAAHAFDCSHLGRPIGHFGEAEVFSFHATKFVNAFEGGAITTNDDDLAHRVRDMGRFGFHGYDNVVSIGTNGKITEICAAMALTSIESIDDIIETNERHYHTYHRRLGEVEGITLFRYGEGRRNFQYVIAEVDAAKTGISRDTLVEALHAENVLARRYFYPGCHRLEPYCTLEPDVGERLPHTEALTERVMSLPTGTAMTIDRVERVCDLISFLCRNGAAITRRQQAGVSVS